jgi:small subunit ribosomal protein S16
VEFSGHIKFDHLEKKQETCSMVRIRLRRVGMRHQPSYRIVVADIESPRDGRFLEIVGTYDPTSDPFTIDVKEIVFYEWMKNRAVPSESVTRIFTKVA